MTHLTRATRRAATAHSIERRVEAVSARFLSPPTLFCVWTLCALLSFGAVVAGMTRVPRYVSGPAIVVEHADSSRGQLVVFLPPESLPWLRPGQMLLLQSEDGRELKPRTVAAVEPRLAGAAFIQEQLASTRHPRRPGMRSAAVATAQLEPTESAMGCSACDATCSARIQVGSQRAIFLAPIIRRWLSREDP